jgi:outer membrane protein assembly factor BamD (BamD/ComL family)
MASQPTPVQQQPQPAQPQPTRPVVSAVVQPTKHLDVKKLLKEAEAAKRKGDYGTARGKYAAVLSEDPGNAEATAALASLPAPGANQQASSDADVLLAKGIGEFYSGAYEDAEVHIKDYIGINGAKTPLAYFYRGASLLTRYYLHGEQDHHLLTEAQDDFKHAKKDSAFHPPDKLVSPKIIKVFEQTS